VAGGASLTRRGRERLSGPDITAEGRLAGRTFAIVLVATGAGVIAGGWGDLWRRCGRTDETCVSRSASAVLLAIGAVVAIAVGAFVWRRVSRRPVDEDGSSRFVWWFGALLALGAVFLASRVPADTCASGHFDDLLKLCLDPPTTSEPSRWLWAKEAIVAAGLVLAMVVVARTRWARVTVPLATAVFAAGAGWMIVALLVHG
jgi:hypothetical protein